MNELIRSIPLEEIYPHPDNRRIGGFDPVKLEQLAESIRAVGVQQPAVVRNPPGGVPAAAAKQYPTAQYELIAGERRWRASKLAGQETLPCVIRELDDLTVLKVQTIENLQREDVHPLDEADGYARLIERAGYDVELVAEEIGKSPSYVYQRLKLRELIEPARQLLADGTMTAGHAILIARLPADQQKELAGSWMFDRAEPVSVRQLDQFIHSNILLDLNKAAFKKDDGELDLKAGPCTTCPKRTGFQPVLFADVSNGGKRDYCTDPPCFHGKLAALVERRRAEAQESGEKVVEVIDGYIQYDQRRRLGTTIKDEYQWTECKKKDPNAVRCLVVAGTSPGRLTWGKIHRFQAAEKTPEEKEQRKAELAARKAATPRRMEAYRAILESAAGADFLAHESILRAVVAMVFERLWDQHRKKLQALEGWEVTQAWEARQAAVAKHLEKLDREGLRLMLLKCLLVPALEYNPYSGLDELKRLVDLGEHFGVTDPLPELRKEIQEREARFHRYEEDPEEDWEAEEDPDDDPEYIEPPEDEEDDAS